jgi:hypothetical protein
MRAYDNFRALCASFSDVLNWEEFSVKIPSSDIPKLKTILESIPMDKYVQPQLPSVKEGMTSCQTISNGSRSWQMRLAVAERHEDEPFQIPRTPRVLFFLFKRLMYVTGQKRRGAHERRTGKKFFQESFIVMTEFL